ncbi:MAG: hypothetical protein RMI91_14955 [Gemmatales bacterium]|nr:hypothetical protein [Gemmatales bacterium]MDW7995943.1 hypothetical protein [Gemmatales bacterium]
MESHVFMRRSVGQRALVGWLSWQLCLVCVALVSSQAPQGSQLAEQRVRLVGRMALDEALRRLNEQSAGHGNRLVDLRPFFGQRTENPVLDLHLPEGTFWQACDALAHAAKLRVVLLPPNEERELTVGLLGPASDQGLALAPTVYLGPFRVRLVEAQAVRSYEDPALSRLELTTEWACEPRYLPIWLRTERDSVRWRSADGTEHVAAQAGQGTIKWLGEAALRWRFSLPLPPRPQGQLPLLAVQVSALVAPKRLAFHITPLAAQQTLRADDVTVTLRSAEYDAPNAQWRFAVQLDYPPANGSRGFELESFHTWIMDAARFWLQAKEQNRTVPPLRAPTVAVQGRHAFQLELVFPAPEKSRPAEAPAWALHGLIPATPVRVLLQATFRDIPLP